MTGYVTWGWWSGRKPSALGRALGIGLLLASAAIVSMYLHGYSSSPHHPLAPSLRSRGRRRSEVPEPRAFTRASSSTVARGPVPLAILTATVMLLGVVARPDARRTSACPGPDGGHRVDDQRGRRRGRIRASLGPDIPISAVMSHWQSLCSCACVLLVACLRNATRPSVNPRGPAGTHDPGATRRPPIRRKYGGPCSSRSNASSEGLREHVSIPILLKRACPVLFPDRRLRTWCIQDAQGRSDGPLRGVRGRPGRHGGGPAARFGDE